MKPTEEVKEIQLGNRKVIEMQLFNRKVQIKKESWGFPDS